MNFSVDSPNQSQSLTPPETNKTMEISSKNVGNLPECKKKILQRTSKSFSSISDSLTPVPGTVSQPDAGRMKEFGADEESTMRCNPEEVICVRVRQAMVADSLREAQITLRNILETNKILLVCFLVMLCLVILGFVNWTLVKVNQTLLSPSFQGHNQIFSWCRKWVFPSIVEINGMESGLAYIQGYSFRQTDPNKKDDNFVS